MSSSQNEPKANFLIQAGHADINILDRVVFLCFEKILDKVEFEHQVGTYPYENDRLSPPPPTREPSVSHFEQDAFLGLQ